MGKRLRNHDWSTSPLGDPSSWPQSLRSALSICLNSPIVSALYWGDDFYMLYNDAYAPALAERHPWAMARPLGEVWAEIWDVLRPQLEQVVRTRQGFAIDSQRLIMKRRGREEETFWTYSFTPINGEDDSIVGVFITAIDTTDQVISDRRNIAERDRVWQHSRDLQIIVGGGGIFRAVSPAWTRVFGHFPDEVVGRSFLDFLHPDDSAITRNALTAATGGDELSGFENRYLHKDGTVRWISWHTSFDENLVYAYGRDITVEKAAEAELLRTQETLRQSQKMEAVGQLTGGIAHDFNNMLGVVLGALNILTRRLKDVEPSTKKYIDTATEAVKRAAQLTHGLLAFSRQQALNPEPIDMSRLIKRYV